MSILAECPICRQKQSAKNRICRCGEDLVKAKRSKKVKYWISYRLPGGKQRRESIGYSVEEARDAEGKRRSQKRENRIFDMLPEANMTFEELFNWYINLKSVKKLSSHRRITSALNNFIKVFGDRKIPSVKSHELEDYQEYREEQDAALATIDMEISIAKTMVTKGFDNDLVDGRIIKAFRGVRRKLKHGANARKRKMTFDEYIRLLSVSQPHLKPILTVAYNTGMRRGELLGLKWSYIDLETMFIRLPANVVKEKKAKIIPINNNVHRILNSIPRAIKHDYVFTYKGQPIDTESGIKKSFKTACRLAGVIYGRDVPGGLVFHDIRRTVKSNMLEAGIEKELRDTILGHSLKGMDVYYLSISEQSLKDAMDKYTKWLDQKVAEVFGSVDQSVDQTKKGT
jgi:integrase